MFLFFFSFVHVTERLHCGILCTIDLLAYQNMQQFICISMYHLGGSGGSPRKFSENTCSEIASETSFGPKYGAKI